MSSSAPKSSKVFSSSLKWLGLCFVGTLAAVYIVIDTATSEGFMHTLEVAGETLRSATEKSATDQMLNWLGLVPNDDTYIENEVAYEIQEGEEVNKEEKVLGVNTNKEIRVIGDVSLLLLSPPKTIKVSSADGGEHIIINVPEKEGDWRAEDFVELVKGELDNRGLNDMNGVILVKWFNYENLEQTVKIPFEYSEVLR